jgi:hypothetical protein
MMERLVRQIGSLRTATTDSIVLSRWSTIVQSSERAMTAVIVKPEKVRLFLDELETRVEQHF